MIFQDGRHSISVIFSWILFNTVNDMRTVTLFTKFHVNSFNLLHLLWLFEIFYRNPMSAIFNFMLLPHSGLFFHESLGLWVLLMLTNIGHISSHTTSSLDSQPITGEDFHLKYPISNIPQSYTFISHRHSHANYTL